MFKKSTKVERTETALEKENIELQDQTKSMTSNNSADITILTKVNSLLQYMTRMDYVKEMINDMKQQSELVESVSTSSEELSATTEDISSFIQESSRMASDSTSNSQNAIEQIKDAFSRIDVTMKKTIDVNESMNFVNEETKKINDMVSIIQSVANQTNLLALNASIEAARAGEHGKGFAVVAGEIKKLADNTKKQVEFIQNAVLSLVKEVENASSILQNVTGSIDESKRYIDNAISSISGINTSMSEINHSFIEISANTEEQTAVFEDMSSNLMLINEKNHQINDEVIRTGKSFYEISSLVDEIRILSINSADSIDPLVQIEVCICDHLMWRWRVYNMILGNVELNESEVGTHLTCRLGKWVLKQDKTDVKLNNILNELEKPHADLHELAKKAISKYKENNIRAAEDYLLEMDECSRKVIKCLEKIKELY